MSGRHRENRTAGRMISAATAAVVLMLVAVGVGVAAADGDDHPPRDDAARQILARPPFPPQDRSLFTTQTYGFPPTPPALTPQTDATVRATVNRTLTTRFANKPQQAQQAKQVIDDTQLTTEVPDIRLRGAIAALSGTDAAGAIDVYRDGTFASVRFAPLPSPTLIAFSTTEPGQTKRSILVNPIYQNEDTRLLASVMAHEAFHLDNISGSTQEELVANAVQAVVLAQTLAEDSSFATLRTDLSRRLNTQTLALINTRDERGFIRIFASQGNVYPGGLAPLACFGAAFGLAGSPESPGSAYLAQAIESITGQGGPRAFDAATLDLLDRKIDSGLTARQWVNAAKALRLNLNPRPQPNAVVPAGPTGLAPLLDHTGPDA